MKITKEHVGKRCLIKRYDIRSDHTYEVTIQEIAPSGKYVKLWWRKDYIAWDMIDEYSIVEILPKLKTMQEKRAAKVQAFENRIKPK